jgi:hypothetical protein
MLKRVITAAALSAAMSAFAAPNLLIDGSFESAVLPDGDYGMYAGTSLYGWNAVEGSIEVRRDIVGTAKDGDYFVELDSNSNSVMSQPFATVAGQAYTLSFWYSNRPASLAYNGVFPGGVAPASTNGLSYDVGSGAVDVPALVANITNDNVWTEYTTTFVATGDTTTLTFAATGTDDSFGSSLDDVSVTAAVPEPGMLAMMGAGLLGLIGLGRRRQG